MPEVKRSLGRPGSKWENKIKILHLREMGRERLMSAFCEGSNPTSESIKCWEFHEWLSNFWLLREE
jgi:hypothetical protein